MLQFKDFSFIYAGSEALALRSIDLDIFAGEFVVICGSSSSGKTTLIKSMKESIAPVGRKTGEVSTELSEGDIAIVFQNPETQMVTGSVLHDLVFHMENLGFPNDLMRKRLAETVGFFGIEHLLHKNANDLSGGQKQLVSLCGALMSEPKLLLLDEPVSQLDPIAAQEFLETLKRVNEEFSVTIVLTEHRLDEVITLCDKIVLLDCGAVKYSGTPEEVTRQIWQDKDREHYLFIPTIPRVSLTIDEAAPVCFTPKELKAKLSAKAETKFLTEDIKREEILSIKNLLFAYQRGEYVLKNLNLDLYHKEFLCVLGGNGSGKSTLLKTIAGIIRPYMGKINKKDKNQKIAYMPQNSTAYFCHDTVRAELEPAFVSPEYYKRVLRLLNIEPLLERHPYDLSGGEVQKVVIASILFRKPDLIVLDEPTKGLDPYSKRVVAKLLKEVDATIVISTHDLEFAAENADRCAMLFDGEVAFANSPRKFLGGNRYYTTPINKASKHINKEAILYKDVTELCGKEAPSFFLE